VVYAVKFLLVAWLLSMMILY